MLSQYYKPPSSKRINYLKFSYFSIIIVALSSFYLFASTTTSLADAQNATNSTEISTLFETADTLYSQKKYDEAIKYYDKILVINAQRLMLSILKVFLYGDCTNIMNPSHILTKFFR